ncbi:MAG TPA: SusC/RagA family TonB-linked outer membrane protein, partial [Gemmatimonadaceae bacterium]|nr:SusC/RagA family TonB-linked outer membrane protein [Gemmatimonadaceae bacterium]
ADPFRLDEVVVTGVAEATSARKLTISVARVSEEQLKQVPASSPVAALSGKVAGVRISGGRGNPGAAPAIRLRGSTNLAAGGSSPLVIVDGVITRNSISDIDANDIESIEVLKGAAAASFYGSDAANGVVAITTKRGRNVADGDLNVSLRTEYGQSDLPRMIPLMEHHPFTTNADGSVNWGTYDADRIADNPFPSTGENRWRNQLEEWMTNGAFYSMNVQAGARRGNTNFNGSFTNERNQGTLPLTSGLFRRNARINVDQGIGSKADMSIGLTYGLQNNDFDPNAGGSGSVFFSLLQAPGDVDLRYPDEDVTDIEYYPAIPGNNRGNPLYQLANEDFQQRRERILGSFSTRYRPVEWLRLEGSYGTDRLNRQDKTYQFRGYLNLDGEETNGSLDAVTYFNWSSNAQASATATKLFMDQVLSTTRLAYLYEDERYNWTQAGGSQLNVGGTPDLNAVDPGQNYVASSTEASRTIDYMVSQAFDIKDRYLVDALYRRDGSSLFGSANRWADFYRVSGAYRISEDFQIPGVQELKIRAARGTAGLRPSYAAQYETFALSGGRPIQQNLGNKELRPAIQTEDEFGINTAFLDRFDLELVYAKRLTEGAFLNVPLSVSKGGFQYQWQNAADVSANTAEISLNTRVWDSPNFSYNFSLTADRTRQKIDRLDRAAYRPDVGGQGQNVFYYKEGEVLGVVYGTKWVRSFEELQSIPAFANANPADYTVNGLGYLVRVASPSAPIAWRDADGQTTTRIGDVNPDFSFGFANNIRVRGFNIYALFDGQKGGDVYNFSKQWMFQDLRHGDIDQSGVPADKQVRADFFATGLYNALNASDYFVEDASHVKLRELSVSYTLGSEQLGRIGLSNYAEGVKLALIGRNLYTWTDFSGFDPDVTSAGDFNYRIEGFRYPQFRTISAQVELNF